MPIPQRPTKLGPYDVIAKIASGGMAHVYLGRARDLTGAERVAAVKVMRHDFGGDEQALHMFLDEAKLLSRLSHPNIIQTLEFGTTGEHPFIAMELLLGRTIMDVWETCVQEGIALRFDLAAWIAARVADGLHYAHELTDESGAPLHLIHRDVNPSNVFLSFDGRVKLFDFGLAKASSRRHRSSAGIVKGKLPYLSPEQIMELPLDPRSDVYTLGTTLWEMVTMRRLFKRDSDVETVKAVRSAKIPDPRTLVTGCPEPLAKIVLRSLERNREHRYQTAREFSNDLDAYLARVGTPDASSVIPAILDRLFPGDRMRQTGWLKAAGAPTAPRNTFAPPVPLPMQRAPGETSVPPPTSSSSAVSSAPVSSDRRGISSATPPPKPTMPPSLRPNVPNSGSATRPPIPASLPPIPAGLPPTPAPSSTPSRPPSLPPRLPPKAPK